MILACPSPANVACEKRDVHSGNGDQRIHQARAECRDNGESQQDVRKGHQHIDNPHNDVVRPPAEIARDNADGRPNEGGNNRGCKTDSQRKACAPHQTRQQIAAEMIRAKQIAFGKRSDETVRGLGDIGVLQRQQWRGKRQQNDDCHNDSARRGQFVAKQQFEKGAHVLILGSSMDWATSTMMLNRT